MTYSDLYMMNYHDTFMRIKTVILSSFFFPFLFLFLYVYENSLFFVFLRSILLIFVWKWKDFFFKDLNVRLLKFQFHLSIVFLSLLFFITCSISSLLKVLKNRPPECPANVLRLEVRRYSDFSISYGDVFWPCGYPILGNNLST